MDNKEANQNCEVGMSSKEDANLGSFLRSKRNVLFWLATIIICLSVIIFFLLPPAFLLLAYVFPRIYAGTSLLQQLSNNINSAVGVVSLAVGVFSIRYAYNSNKNMEKHTQSQESFLREIKNLLEDTFDKVKKAEKATDVFSKTEVLDKKSIIKIKAEDELETD